MTITRTLRANPDVFKKLKDIADTEGRTMGKMFEIMISEYEKNHKDDESN